MWEEMRESRNYNQGMMEARVTGGFELGVNVLSINKRSHAMRIPCELLLPQRLV